MSDSRTHNNPSNRAKPKHALERKPVFKSVLDNPFRVHWPSVPINVQNSCLAKVISILDGVSTFHVRRSQDSRKRRYSRQKGPERSKKRKVDAVGKDEDASMEEPSVESAHASTDAVPTVEEPTIERPAILDHLVVGINAVTKRLEAQVAATRHSVVLSVKDPPPAPQLPPAIKLIFVCRADVDPPLLIDHIPHLVAAFNASIRPGLPLGETSQRVKIVPLPKGAEFTLAEIMGLRRVAIIALDTNASEVSMFDDVTETIPTPTAPWLHQATLPANNLIATHIKQVRTSAPKHMKEAKELRAKGKATAKERRKTATPKQKT